MTHFFSDQEHIRGSRYAADRAKSFEYAMGFITEDDVSNSLSNQGVVRLLLAKCVVGFIR